MGLFDAIKKAVGGGGGASDAENEKQLLAAILQIIANQKTGGLQGLLKLFQDAGFAEQVSSWVGTGANQPISAGQIKEIFGGGKLTDIANKTGISEEATAAKLADMLPNIIDKLTLYGQIPEGDVLTQRIGMLKGDSGW